MFRVNDQESAIFEKINNFPSSILNICIVKSYVGKSKKNAKENRMHYLFHYFSQMFQLTHKDHSYSQNVPVDIWIILTS